MAVDAPPVRRNHRFLQLTRPGFGVRALYDETKAHKAGSTIPIKLQLFVDVLAALDEARATR